MKLSTRGRCVATAAIIVLSVSACNGGKSSSGPTTTGDLPTTDAPSASATQGGTTDLSSFHMCTALKEADALALGKQFNIGQSATATYKFMTEMEMMSTSEHPAASCTFTIYQTLPDGTSGSEAIVDILVEPSKFADTIGGKKVDIGIGDYALDEGESDQVIFGNLMIESDSSQGASEDLVNAMMKAIIPNVPS